jgi:hypothetical protein
VGVNSTALLTSRENKVNAPNVSESSSLEATRMRDAYQSLLTEIQSVEEESLIHINVDIPTAVTTALGALPEIRAMRPKIEAELKSFDLVQFDKLETYIFALFNAHTLYVTANRPIEPLPELVEAATRIRDLLFSDAMALVNRGMLDGQQLRDVKTANGYRPLALDLTALAAVMRANWERIESKTAVQASELSQVESLAERLLHAIGLRDQAPAVVAESAATRQRAFTLFVRAYDDLRRAVTFLRWRDGDVDKIAPSLYASRGGSRRKSEPDVAAPVDAPPLGAPSVGDPVGAAGRVPVVPSLVPGPAAASIGLGLPGSDPFVRA